MNASAYGNKVKARKEVEIRKGLAIGLVLALLAALAVLCFFIFRPNTQTPGAVLEEKLELLEDIKGRYDENSILLKGATEKQVKALADRYGASLRISVSGNYAVVTL